MVTFFKFVFFGAIAVYALCIALLYCMQRQLIYHPQKPVLPPSQYGLEGFGEYMVKTADNESIQLWYHAAQPGFPTIIYFHGNAGNIGDRVLIFSSLSKKGFGILAVSYRGYGKSTGSPSEAGLYNDARAAVAFAIKQNRIPVGKIILYGESLGTGVAVQMATEYDVGALVLQAPYTSVAARAAEIYYYAPVNWLIKDSYNSLSKIARVKAPLLLFHGESDMVIPLPHAKTLFAAAQEPKEAVFFPGLGHNNFDSSVISEHVLNFSRSHNLAPK